MKKKLKVIVIALALVMLLSTLFACQSNPVTPEQPDLITATSITVTPKKITFEIGDSFVYEGLDVQIKYSNNTQAQAESGDYTVDSSNFDSTKQGEYKIKVTLKGTNVNSEYIVSVLAKPNYSDSIKILSIGNSFSDDAHSYLYGILKGYNVKNIQLANMYIGGALLTQHKSNAKSDSKAYTYKYRNNSNISVNTSNVSIKEALEKENWDIVTLQQGSPSSGVIATYNSDIDYLTDYVRQYATNTNVKIAWHMTWAYHKNTTLDAFATYDKDQLNMYNKIVESVEGKVVPNSEFRFVIPAGTAIQNTRTSYIGDNLNVSDGYHLNETGKYIAGQTWAAIFGFNIDTFNNNDIIASLRDYADVIKESVKNACKNPYSVTNSVYIKSPLPEPEPELEPEPIPEPNLTDYDLLNWYPVGGIYWVSTSYATNTADDGNGKNFVSSGVRFTKEQIPVGSIITIENGWKYRPEKWNITNDKSTLTRLNETAEAKVLVNDSWWRGAVLCAFNVSGSIGGSQSRMMQAKDALKIYIPKGTEQVDLQDEYDDSIVIDTVNYIKLDLLPLIMEKDCTKITPSQNIIGTSNKKIVSFDFFNSLALPVGSKIIIDASYDVTIDAWESDSSVSTLRPEKIKSNGSSIVIDIDENWWGNNVSCVFNLSLSNDGALYQKGHIAIGHIRIYVPNN